MTTSFKQFFEEYKDTLIETSHLFEQSDTEINTRERKTLGRMFAQIVKHAEKDENEAARDDHEEDVQFFKAVQHAYRQLYRAIKMDIGWVGLIKMFRGLDEDIQIELTSRLKNEHGPDANAIRHYFGVE